MRTCLCRFGLSLRLGAKGSERVIPELIEPGPQGGEPLRVDGVNAARAFSVIDDETGFLANAASDIVGALRQGANRQAEDDTDPAGWMRRCHAETAR